MGKRKRRRRREGTCKQQRRKEKASETFVISLKPFNRRTASGLPSHLFSLPHPSFPQTGGKKGEERERERETPRHLILRATAPSNEP